MVDVYGADPIRAGAILYAVLVRGMYHETTERYADVTFVVHGETGTFRV